MPAVPSSSIEPIRDQIANLLPAREVPHPLGCHRCRIPDHIVLDTLVQMQGVGCAWARIADPPGSATTLRRRPDDVVIDCCITKAPCNGEVAGRSPVDGDT